jgi:Pyruvate/2-oxoacid:ferredoxin oxidoreductase delta subunit
VVLEPLKWGAKSVELRAPDCSGCGLHKTARQWKKVIKLTRGVLESVSLDPGRIVHLTVPLGSPEQAPSPKETAVSRRGFFRAFAEKWEEVDDSPGSDAENPVEVVIEPFRDLVRNHAANPKRSHLLDVLRALPGARAFKTDYSAQGLPVASIEIGPKCTGCDVCETLCPVGAIHHSESDGHYALSYTPSLCTGCRVCADACFHRAIRVSDNVDLSLLFLGTQQKLVTGEKRTCEFCRQPFLRSADESFCPLCITTEKRREKMARRFARRGTKND